MKSRHRSILLALGLAACLVSTQICSRAQALTISASFTGKTSIKCEATARLGGLPERYDHSALTGNAGFNDMKLVPLTASRQGQAAGRGFCARHATGNYDFFIACPAARFLL